jgi:hypothetical protein
MSPTPADFDLTASDLQSWRANAKWLKASADVLFDLFSSQMKTSFDDPSRPELVPVEVGYVAMMLAGLTLENLAKALVIRWEGLRSTSPGRLPKHLKEHGVRNYLSRGEFQLSDEEQELVERFELFVRWAGRYPVPQHAQGYGKVLAKGSDIQKFRDLYARLDQSLISRT